MGYILQNVPVLNKSVKNLTSNGTIDIPAGHCICQLVIENTTANDVLGGIKIGTTNGGTEVIASLTATGNTLSHCPDATFIKKIFSMSATTTLFIQAVTSWNSANINITVLLDNINL